MSFDVPVWNKGARNPKMTGISSVDSSSKKVLQPCTCSIESLLSNPFYSLTFSEKLKVIETGPPKPNLSPFAQGNINGSGEMAVPDLQACCKKTSWLCGCKKTKKLYCWPCLLFSKKTDDWNKYGFDDFINLKNAINDHELSITHVLCTKEIQLFGKSKEVTKCSFSVKYKNAIESYNENIAHNRSVISHIITAVCFLGSHGLNFYDFSNFDRGDNKASSIINNGNYYSLIKIFANYNSDLKTHIRAMKSFSVFTPAVCNDLLFCISEVMINELKKEIYCTNFVSILINGIMDVSIVNRLTCVIRYIDKKGVVNERFLSFIDLKSDRSSTSLHESIVKISNEFDCGSKLIAYYLDGAVIEIDELKNVQKKAQEKFKQAIFVNSLSDKLNVILSQSVCFFKEIKIFFGFLSTFRNFFETYVKRSSALEPNLFLSITPNKWNTLSKMVGNIRQNKMKFENMLVGIIFEPFDWDLNTVSLAYNLYVVLRDFDFSFYLEIFYLTLPVADDLYVLIQKNILTDLNYCLKMIEDFKSYLIKLSDNFDEFWKFLCNRFYQHCKAKEMSDERIKEAIPDEKKYMHRQGFAKIIKVLISNVEIRYSNLSKLKFCNLLNCKSFTLYRKVFPNKEFRSLKRSSYASYFDLSHLRNELQVMYSDDDMIKDDVFKLFRFLRRRDMPKNFTETFKLCELVLTLPLISSTYKNQSTALSRINNFISNTHIHHSLQSSTALLCIERSFLDKLKSTKEFEDNVISMFATKNNTIKLSYIR